MKCEGRLRQTECRTKSTGQTHWWAKLGCRHWAAVNDPLYCCFPLTWCAPLQTQDKHINLATVLLGQIKARALDQYNSMVEDLLCGKGDRGAVDMRG